MKELKTLKELLDEVGSFPFQAMTVHGTLINVVGKGPGDKYLIWYQKTENIDLKVPDVDKCWTLVPRKIEITESEFDSAISEMSQIHDSNLCSLLQDLKYKLFDK